MTSRTDIVPTKSRPKPRQPKGGSRKGIPNKSTALAREAIATLVDANVPLMQAWLVEIKKKHGALVAFKCLTDIMEYHVPKLARTEHTGEGGGPLRIVASANEEGL